MLELEAELKWKRFLDRHYDDLEHGDCNECLQQMYPRRTVYTKAWLRLFSNNIEAIKGGAKMPQLHWRSAPTATEELKSDFHARRCKSAYESCTCDLALLLQCLSNTPHHRSLDQIVTLWKQVKT
jgi:hypothetical protein